MNYSTSGSRLAQNKCWRVQNACQLGLRNYSRPPTKCGSRCRQMKRRPMLRQSALTGATPLPRQSTNSACHANLIYLERVTHLSSMNVKISLVSAGSVKTKTNGDRKPAAISGLLCGSKWWERSTCDRDHGYNWYLCLWARCLQVKLDLDQTQANAAAQRLCWAASLLGIRAIKSSDIDFWTLN